MLNIKNYRLGFEFCGFLLSLAMLLPNLIWSFVPAPHDILRSAETVASLGIATLVLRLLTMATSMFVVNVESNELNVRYSHIRIGLLRGLVSLLRGAGVRSRARIHFRCADRYVHYAFVRPQKRFLAAFDDRVRRRSPRLHYLRHNVDRRLKLLPRLYLRPILG